MSSGATVFDNTLSQCAWHAAKTSHANNGDLLPNDRDNLEGFIQNFIEARSILSPHPSKTEGIYDPFARLIAAQPDRDFRVATSLPYSEETKQEIFALFRASLLGDSSRWADFAAFQVHGSIESGATQIVRPVFDQFLSRVPDGADRIREVHSRYIATGMPRDVLNIYSKKFMRSKSVYSEDGPKFSQFDEEFGSHSAEFSLAFLFDWYCRAHSYRSVGMQKWSEAGSEDSRGSHQRGGPMFAMHALRTAALGGPSEPIAVIEGTRSAIRLGYALDFGDLVGKIISANAFTTREKKLDARGIVDLLHGLRVARRELDEQIADILNKKRKKHAVRREVNDLYTKMLLMSGMPASLRGGIAAKIALRIIPISGLVVFFDPALALSATSEIDSVYLKRSVETTQGLASIFSSSPPVIPLRLLLSGDRPLERIARNVFFTFCKFEGFNRDENIVDILADIAL